MAESLGLLFARDLINEGSIVVDVGAGIYSGGADYVTAFIETVGPEGKVYAFDPFSIDTVPDNPNLIKIGKSVWSSSGRFKPEVLFPWGVPKAMSTGWRPEVEKEEYEAVSLDDFFPTEKIDFVKMDIEGAEAQALLGMKNLIDRNPDFKMILECHWSYLSMFNSSTDKIWEFLKERNLSIYKLGISNLLVPVNKEDFNIGLGSHVFMARDSNLVASKYKFEEVGDRTIGYKLQ